MNEFEINFLNLLKMNKQELKRPEIEYQALLIEHYNKDPLTAFNTFVTLRNELLNYLTDKRSEFENEIQFFIKTAEQFDVEEEKLTKLESLFKQQLNNSDFDLSYEIDLLFNSSYTSDKFFGPPFPERIHSSILNFINQTKHYRNSIILYNVTFSMVNDILTHSLPISFELNTKTAHLYNYEIKVPIEKPHQDEIYKWYQEIKTTERDLNSAFQELCKMITNRGLNLSDYINTDTPENFDRSYRNFLNRRKRNSNKNGI